MTSIEVGTILSHRTKQGIVEFSINGEKAQMDIAKAREVADMLQRDRGSISDTLIHAFDGKSAS
jgi:hypothetical protein